MTFCGPISWFLPHAKLELVWSSGMTVAKCIICLNWCLLTCSEECIIFSPGFHCQWRENLEIQSSEDKCRIVKNLGIFSPSDFIVIDVNTLFQQSFRKICNMIVKRGGEEERYAPKREGLLKMKKVSASEKTVWKMV